MASHGLKSDKKQPYQKKMNPFWRESKESLMGYSEEVKHQFELKKLAYDQNCTYYQWTKKPKAE